MNSKILWLLGAATATAMVGSTACVVVDSTGSGGSGGSGGDSSNVASTDSSTDAGVTTSTSGAGGGGACVSCAEFVTNGADPSDLCESSYKIAEALIDCACSKCVDACGAQCDSTAAACEECLQGTATGDCSAEFQACANDT